MGELYKMIQRMENREAAKKHMAKVKKAETLKQMEHQSKWRPPDGGGCA